MSVILYDSENKLMIADSRAYCGDTHPFGTKRKIHRLSDGSLLGMCSSTPGVPEEFMAWLERGSRPDDYGPANIDLDAILVKQSGEIFLYSDSYFKCGPLTGDVFTIGSGKKYALGAWHAGADAQHAIEVAIACDSMCDGPIMSMPLHEPQTAEEVASLPSQDVA